MASVLPRRRKRNAPKVAAARAGRQRGAAPDPLRVIPGIGPAMARDLRDLGIRQVADLRGQDPERLYRRLIRLRGVPQDRCVLYVFRCAVYYAGARRPRPELLRWWNWKDGH